MNGHAPVTALVEDWLRALVIRGISPSTRVAYNHDVWRYLRAIGDPGAMTGDDLGAVTQPQMRSWMADLRRAGLGKASVGRALSAVKSFYNHVSEAHGIRADVVRAARGPPAPQPPPPPPRPRGGGARGAPPHAPRAQQGAGA